MASVSLTLRFAGNKALGPARFRLPARATRMSYPRAWKLVDELNAAFAAPLVVTQIGGAARGGATPTLLGHGVVRRYRSIEARIYTASARHLSVREGVLAK